MSCPDLLKPKSSGLEVCTSEVCFDANLSCLNVPLGANLSQALALMDAALCTATYYSGTIPSCLTPGADPTMQDILELVAAEICYSGAVPSCITVGANPTVQEVVEQIGSVLCSPALPTVSYVYSDLQAVDFSWVDGVPTLVPGMSHLVASPDGNYTVRVDLINTYADTANGTITLLVDAVVVATWGPFIQNGITSTYSSDGFTWRGPVNNGQTIKVLTEKTGAPAISTKNFSWLINKS